jgi:hypothetical protein
VEVVDVAKGTHNGRLWDVERSAARAERRSDRVDDKSVLATVFPARDERRLCVIIAARIAPDRAGERVGLHAEPAQGDEPLRGRAHERR